MPCGRIFVAACSLAASLWICPCAVSDGLPGFHVPKGFVVTQFADDDLAHNIYSLTFDAEGRAVVAGPGYVNILHDDDGDGRADRATRFADVPGSGAQGMYFDGRDLICTGDGGLRRLRDRNGDGQVDEIGPAWAKLANPEHGAHGVVKGPDGWFYVICGNDAGVTRDHVTSSTSPITDPHCGVVLRVSPDGEQIEVFAEGFRNPYDLDFDASGHLWTVDSDGERAHHLPWYTPTRLFDVAQGMHHGWLESGWQRNWARPAAFFDNVTRAAELGRGSPTGLVVYRHRQFPARYCGGVFSACWTLGRIYFLPLQRDGATYVSQPELFLESSAESGFAPVDMAVSPKGDLFVAIGGRGTRGSVYRIRYEAAAPVERRRATPLDMVLKADQPLASWSRAAWVPIARLLGREPFERALLDRSRDVLARCRAVEVLTELYGGPTLVTARRATLDGEPTLNARIAWSLTQSKADDRRLTSLLAELTYDRDPLVARAAWDGLARRGTLALNLSTQPNWRGAMNTADRRVRWAMLNVARGGGAESFRQAAGSFHPQAPGRELLSYLWVIGPRTPDDAVWTETYLRSALHGLEASDDPGIRLEAVRLMQIGLGDIRPERDLHGAPTGYLGATAEAIDFRLRESLAGRLAEAFPTSDTELDRELARLLAMLEVPVPGFLEALRRRWTADSDPVEDVHDLIVASQIPGERTAEVTETIAAAFSRLDGKLAARGWFPSRTWPERVVDAFVRLSQYDARLPQALLAHEDFGRPAHAMFAAAMPTEPRNAAARRLLVRLGALDPEDIELGVELTELLALVPPREAAPVLRHLWESVGHRDLVLPLLARTPSEEDRARYIEALSSVDDAVVRHAARALCELDGSPDAEELIAAIVALSRYQPRGAAILARALGRQNDNEQAAAQRETFAALEQLLEAWLRSEQATGGSDEPADAFTGGLSRWRSWFADQYPEATEELDRRLGRRAPWRDRLAQVPWEEGGAERGQRVFQRQGCHRCHLGRSRLGPDLRGVATRLSRTDLFAAIGDPHRNVSPAYRTSLVTTRSGRAYHGLVIYESPEGTLLQIDAEKTIRIDGEEQPKIVPRQGSLMPGGLLDPLSERDMADLYSYLLSLDDERH